MRKLIIAAALAFTPAAGLAAGADGVWKTEPGDSGGYLEITIGACASDAGKTCGVITKAYSKDGPDPDYANIGKLLVKDMTFDGDKNYDDGTIWDPEHDKTYSSKMELKGDTLEVDGCISIICSGQNWTKVK